MIEHIEKKGYWFLPNNPENVVAGILTYIPQESIILELIGTFYSDKDPFESFIGDQNEDVIFGVTSDAEKITLLKCSHSGNLNASCSFPIINYKCQFLIIGKHVMSLNEKSAYKVSVEFPELTHWCYPNALKYTVQTDENHNSQISITIDQKPLRETAISDVQIDVNTSVALRKAATYNSSDNFLSPKINQFTYLEIRKIDTISLEEINYIIFKYEQFLSLASLRSVNCSKITLHDDSLFQELANGYRRYLPITLIYIHNNSKEKPPIKSIDFLFNYSQIAKEYPKIIQKWYNGSDEIAPIRAHLIDSINFNMYGSTEFLVIIQAIEGFCTRFRIEASLSVMLNNIIAEYGDFDKLKNDNIVIKEVVDSRHYYSHLMNKSKKPHTLYGFKLYTLTKKLQKILLCCLLNFIGFENNQINDFLNHSNNYLFRKP